MAVEKVTGKYLRYEGTEHEYEHVYEEWVETHEFTEEKDCIKIESRRATNPPTVYRLWDEYVSVPIYCEDGFYVYPSPLLKPGIRSIIQHRTLVTVGFRP